MSLQSLFKFYIFLSFIFHKFILCLHPSWYRSKTRNPHLGWCPISTPFSNRECSDLEVNMKWLGRWFASVIGSCKHSFELWMDKGRKFTFPADLSISLLYPTPQKHHTTAIICAGSGCFSTMSSSWQGSEINPSSHIPPWKVPRRWAGKKGISSAELLPGLFKAGLRSECCGFHWTHI